MSIAPPPAYQTWPPQPYPPAPQPPRRRWPAIAATAAGAAIVAGLVTTLVTFAVTTPETTNTVTSAPSTVTETAAAPPPPAPLPVAQADAQTCRAWQTTDTFVTAGAAAVPPGADFNDPATPNNPAYHAAFTRAGDLFGQAADTFEAQTAPGTNPTLAAVADTTVSSLRALSAAYKSFDPATGNAIAVFQASQKAVDWLCQ